jgi:hypothetical protein
VALVSISLLEAEVLVVVSQPLKVEEAERVDTCITHLAYFLQELLQ